MIKNKRIRVITYIVLMVFAMTFVTGCNRGGDADAQQETPAENADNNANDDNNGNNDNTDNAEDPAAQANPNVNRDAPDEPEQTPIAEKSPVAITRIEPQKIQIPSEPFVTGEGAEPDDEEETVDTDGDGVPDEHDHEPVPNLFPVDKCQVEVNGVYKKELANELITAINKCRTDYAIPIVTRNTSLLACADNRAKEQTYFIGHFRPNGAAFTSIAPEGQVRGECIAVDYREAEKMVEAWYAVNDTRVQLMNPDYTQVGVSIYEVDDTYFIAAEFAY